MPNYYFFLVLRCTSWRLRLFKACTVRARIKRRNKPHYCSYRWFLDILNRFPTGMAASTSVHKTEELFVVLWSDFSAALSQSCCWPFFWVMKSVDWKPHWKAEQSQRWIAKPWIREYTHTTHETCTSGELSCGLKFGCLFFFSPQLHHRVCTASHTRSFESAHLHLKRASFRSCV